MAKESMGLAQMVVPMLTYVDGLAALEWLVKAFGFHEITRMLGDDGILMHGEVLTETGGRIMLANGQSGYQSPKQLSTHYAPAKMWQSVPWVVNGTLVYINDVDMHYERAVAVGAVILTPPEDGFPARRYRAEDVEEQHWMFMQIQA